MNLKSGLLSENTITFLYLLASLFIISLNHTPGFFYPRAGVIPMTDFTAQKPFVYRVLVPSLIRGIEFITPEVIKTKAGEMVTEIVTEKITKYYPERPLETISSISKKGYRIAVYMVLNTAFMFLFLLSLRYLALALGCFSKMSAGLLPLGMIFVFPVYYDFSNYIYDFSHLFLFTSCLLFLYKRNWLGYLITFVLALLNKETAILSTVIFMIFYYDKLDRKEFFILLVIQAFIFIAVKFSLYLIFLDNPGEFVEFHLQRNLKVLSDISSYFRFGPIGPCILFPSGLNIPVAKRLNLPMLAVVAYMVFYGWRHKSIFLRKAFIIIVFLFFLGMAFGYIDELRAYYSILPVIYLLGVSGLLKMMKNFGIIKS